MRLTTILLLVCLMTSHALAQSTFTYTLNEDFERGLLLNVNHDAGDQLQINEIPRPLPYLNFSNSARGTVARLNTTTGEVMGEYHSAPEGFAFTPSRTTVDLVGNAWTANTYDYGTIGGTPYGAVVQVGLITGGSRVDADGSPNPLGGFLAGPFGYNTCLDRDGDGLIRTSRGLGDVLDWTNVTDRLGGADGTGHGLVEDAMDECILAYQRTPDADGVRHLSVDRDNNMWAGGYPGATVHRQAFFHLLDGEDARILDSFDARVFGAGGYSGLVDGNGILWSSSVYQNNMLRYDPVTETGSVINVQSSYGMSIDSNGFIWNTMLGRNTIVKISPDGVIEPGFPKSTGGDSGDRGVAVTPIDNHVWVANCGPNGGTNVSRLDNDGNLLKVIEVGTSPTGVAVDTEGNVWVTHRDSDNVMRIDPNGGNDGLPTA